jgi:hypothetical protein
MKRPFLGIGLILAGLGLASTGCSQTGQKDTTTKSKYTDPSSWSDSDSGSAGRPQSSRLQGGWSSESKDIEKSLGVGN